MKINWKVRFQNEVWLGSFFAVIIGFVFSVMRLLDINPVVTENQILNIVNEVLTFLGIIGVIVDPTTEGLNDSKRAMSYEVPWKDEE